MSEKLFLIISIFVTIFMILPPFLINDVKNYLYWMALTGIYIMMATIYLRRRYK